MVYDNQQELINFDYIVLDSSQFNVMLFYMGNLVARYVFLLLILAVGGITLLSACRRELGDSSNEQLLSPTSLDSRVTASIDVNRGYPEPDSTLESYFETYPLDVATSAQRSPYPSAAENLRIASPVVDSYPIPGTIKSTATSVSNPNTQTPTNEFPNATVMFSPTAIRLQVTPSDPTMFVLSANRPQIVEFYANWSIVAKSMGVVILGLEDEFGNQVNFIYLDIDDPRTIQIQNQLGYEFSSLPHFILIDGQGGLVNEWIGYVTADELQAAISSLLVGAPEGN